ncbi:uncharacterized protein BDR25DRAFT_353470 [Lindgomyces ingoldianus]|uniref:Uncharacterized protein n=1 Tax=Lindgomyces ingoldianus TaxID=673940 RepID=A0ACB6QZN9_9PLEO|nr:uncharacterized protein BDR25DRAFT_353470 [Lindgomyces ingoldianus]KAF2472454.1 hypothetical protein BDR25DRAFT_353470 [Lindgomyces ingoldianus]
MLIFPLSPSISCKKGIDFSKSKGASCLKQTSNQAKRDTPGVSFPGLSFSSLKPRLQSSYIPTRENINPEIAYAFHFSGSMNIPNSANEPTRTPKLRDSVHTPNPFKVEHIYPSIYLNPPALHSTTQPPCSSPPLPLPYYPYPAASKLRPTITS